MPIRGMLAQITVSDLATASPWYTTLFEREPDSRPMDGLQEWHVTAGFGVQVWQDPARAGRSTAVLFTDDDLDAVTARLQDAGLTTSEPAPGGGGRVLQLTDPDGNRVVLVGA